MGVSFSRLIKSFKEAGHGIVHTYKSEQNFRIQIWCAIIAGILAWYFSLRTWEIILIILPIILVLGMELMNTAIEKFCDLLAPRLSYQIKLVKEIMAAGVLLVSVGAGVVGLIIFLPHFINIISIAP